ncbi:hypothetical protein N658DRAFT_114182 [Parathielavia hyrcaniae]|uniref:Uncharacterized protein n=1 Tax=Parathielavia hyrcaniae TaxID=113614 RepID=A0AAN6T5Y1_9PEZI|nr:hypothetical protein N658DRAFT_114182 [Parathielavia hyrcaniae]
MQRSSKTPKPAVSLLPLPTTRAANRQSRIETVASRMSRCCEGAPCASSIFSRPLSLPLCRVVQHTGVTTLHAPACAN